MDTGPSPCFRELLAIASIPVPQQVPRGAVSQECFEQLMSYALGRGVLGDSNVHGPTPIMRKDDEHKQRSKKHGRNHEEVAGNQGLRVVRWECVPRLRGRSQTADHVLRHRRFGMFESQLQQFRLDAWRSPSRIRQTHLPDQVDDLARD